MSALLAYGAFIGFVLGVAAIVAGCICWQEERIKEARKHRLFLQAIRDRAYEEREAFVASGEWHTLELEPFLHRVGYYGDVTK